MISILVPVFNQDVTLLVNTLHQQAKAAGIIAEILVMDDGSTSPSAKSANAQLPDSLNTVTYLPLPLNVGRHLIRHKMAMAAQYNQLLFLDADSGIPDDGWLQRYLDTSSNNTVLVGGRIYHHHQLGQEPLHSKYGKAREDKGAEKRNRHPYRSFMTCNVMFPKKVFLSLLIDARLTGYGHEDTFIGLQLEQQSVPVLHINNPVFHDEVITDQQFIRKQKEAIQSLWLLYNSYSKQLSFEKSVRLIKTHALLQKIAGGTWLLRRLLRHQDFLEKQLLTTRHLFLLDSWKLALWHQQAGQ